MKRFLSFILIAYLAAACSRCAEPSDLVSVSDVFRADDGTVRSRTVQMGRRERTEDVLPLLQPELGDATGTLSLEMHLPPDMLTEIEGRVVQGKLEGSVRTFMTIEGRKVLTAQFTFLHDQKHGPSVAYVPGGGKLYEGAWANGVKTGPWSMYYRDGGRAFAVTFRDDRFDGPATVFDAAGRQLAQGTYENGQPRDGTFIADPWDLVRSVMDVSSTFETKLLRYSGGVRQDEKTIAISKRPAREGATVGASEAHPGR